MRYRRDLLKGGIAAGCILIAGCSSDSQREGTGSNAQRFSVEYEGKAMFVTVSEEAQIAAFQMLAPDGSEIEITTITGAASRTKLLEDAPKTLSEFDKPVQIVALNSDQEEVERAEINYSPKVELGDEIKEKFGVPVRNISNMPTGKIKSELALSPNQIIPKAELEFESSPDFDPPSGEIESRVDGDLSLGFWYEPKGESTAVRSVDGNKTIFEGEHENIPPEETEVIKLIHSTVGSGEPAYPITKEVISFPYDNELINAKDVDKKFNLSGDLRITGNTLNKSPAYSIELEINGFKTEVGRDTFGHEIGYYPEKFNIISISEK